MAEAENQRPTYRIDVSADKLTVTLAIEAGAMVDAADVIAAMRALKIRDFDDGAIIEAAQRAQADPRSIVVARGAPPVDDRPARVEFRVPLHEGPGLAVCRVAAGQLIATVPASQGVVTPTAGRDVFGAPIAFRFLPGGHGLGRNVAAAKGEITALAKGNLRLADGNLSIEPLLEVNADAQQSIDFDGDVSLRGSLPDGRKVRAGGDLICGAAVEAADLQIGGSVQVKGGIIGKNKARCAIAGDLWCRFLSAAHVSVGGSINVIGEVLNSRVLCGGRLTVGGGALVGGEIAATGGVTCATVGNERGIPTLVEAGTDRPQVAIGYESSRAIDAARCRAEQIRNTITPLMERLKSLTPPQREKVTELMAEASELEERARILEEEREAKLRVIGARAAADIVVNDVAHAGVTFRFRGVEATLTSPIKGPVKVTTRKVDLHAEVVMIDGTSRAISILPSRTLSPTAIAAVTESRVA